MASVDFKVKNGLVTGANNTSLGTAVTVLIGGNVGIGDTNPSYKLSVSGSLNATGAITQAGNQVLHASNYNSYVPTFSGTGATGTWGINITGNAVTAGGLAVSSAQAASTIVARDASGYAFFSYINSASPNNENPTISQIVVTTGSDGYYRKSSIASLTSAVQSNASGNWNINSYNITQYPLNQSVLTTAAPTFAGLTSTSNLTVAGGDLYSYRSGGTTGVLFLNSSGSRYLYWDNTTYNLNGAELNINGQRALNAGNYNSYAVTRTSTNRNGVYKLFRNDSDSDYNIQTTWGADRTGYWSLRGYNGDTYHAPCYVGYSGYADSAGSASSATNASNASRATVANGIDTTQPLLGYSYSGVNIDYGGQGGPQIQGQGGGAAMMSFHRPGSYAINLGLGTDNQLRTGGWSRGGNYVVIDSGNYNSYAPTLTGGNASGTWGINITGNANYASSAGSVAWGNVSGRPSYLSEFINNLGNYGGWITSAGSCNYANYSGYIAGSTFCYTTAGLGVGTSYNQGAGYINATQDITAFYSDLRLKENVKPIENAIEKIKQISGVTFNSNDLAESFGYTDKREQVGVIAQEIEKVLPQIIKPAPFDCETIDGKTVSKSGEHYMTVQYEKIVPLLIEAIKEQQKQIDRLNNKIGD